MAKKRTHKLVIRVTFDKPCTITHAVKEVGQCIHGEFYPTQWETTDPGLFKVKSITRPTKAAV